MELIEQIRAMGYEVRPFVVRVADVLDLFLPSGKYGFHTFKWHDLRTDERGRKPLDQMQEFVKERIG